MATQHIRIPTHVCGYAPPPVPPPGLRKTSLGSAAMACREAWPAAAAMRRRPRHVRSDRAFCARGDRLPLHHKARTGGSQMSYLDADHGQSGVRSVSE